MGGTVFKPRGVHSSDLMRAAQYLCMRLLRTKLVSSRNADRSGTFAVDLVGLRQ